VTSYLPIAVDFDGTLAEALWTPENPTTEIGSPIRVNILKVREVHRAGWKVIIHTARPQADTAKIRKWLRDNSVPFDAIHTDKLLAALYIDDRGRHASESSWIPARDALSQTGPVTALRSTLSDEKTSRVPEYGVGYAKHKL
jgi:hypothetical protein